MAGNSNYPDAHIAFAAEQSLTKKFKVIWATANPMLAKLFGNENRFNRGFDIKGNKGLLGVGFAENTDPANGVSDANELTPDTPQPTNGFTQAEYQYAHYRKGFSLRNSEKTTIQGGEARGNILEAKITQLTESFKKAIIEDLWSANNGSREAILGLRYLLSTSNSPGNISQTTYPVWAAQRKTNAGPFQLSLIDEQFDTIVAKGRGVPDLCCLSHTADNNVYGKMRDTIQPSQLITKSDSMAKYGFRGFVYMDMDCVQENKLGEALGGSFTVLTTDSMYLATKGATSKPTLVGSDRLPSTDSWEYYYNWWIMLGCDDPAVNALVDGVQ